MKRIQGFHTPRTESEHPENWILGDFAEIILSSGRARSFDLIPFMTALQQLPEWSDIDFLDSRFRKPTDISLQACFDTIPARELTFQLAKVFNRLVGVFKRADNFGVTELSSFVAYIRDGVVPRKNKKSQPRKTTDEDFVYEGMVNENGEAVGMDISISIPGMRFIITGKLDKKRSLYEDDIRAAGGLISTTVSQADYLVIGENHKEKISRKAKDAQRYDIPAVTLNSLKTALEKTSL